MKKNDWRILTIATLLPWAAAAAATDADRDGIADTTDACPYSLAGSQVDGQGCARDRDADNVADGLDRCPDTDAARTVDAEGCAAGQRAAAPADTAPVAESRTIFDVLGQPSAEPAAAVAPESPPPGRAVTAPSSEPRFFEVPSDPPLLVIAETPVPVSASPAATAPATVPESLPPPGPQTAADDSVPAETVAAPAAPAPVLADDSFSDPLYTSIYFGRGSSALTEASANKLRRSLPDLIRNVDRYPRMLVELAGHADPLSEKGDVQVLAAARAQTLKAFLVERGVPSERIRTSSRGSSKPRLIRGDTARNRRVEILTYPE